LVISTIIISEIIICTGKPGRGKSLSAVYETIRLYRKGYTIYTNQILYHLNHYKLSHPLELLNLPTRLNVILIDEIYQWFDSYIADSSIRIFMRNIFNATRKNTQIVIGTSQTLGMMNLKSRLVVDYLIKPCYYKELNILDQEIYEYTNKNEFLAEEKYQFTKRIKNISRYFPYYYTYEILEGFEKDVWEKQKKNKKKHKNNKKLEDF